MEKCGWQNADAIANDTMQMIKSLWGKINWRCFLKVLFVNKPSHLIELRSGEDQYFFSKVKTFESRHAESKLDLYGSTPSFLHYIEEGLSLSTIKQISNAEKHRYN